MRVIDIESLEFNDFGHQMPNRPYAILSHRWSDSELTYRQYLALDKAELRRQDRPEHSTGLGKILWNCFMARSKGIPYFWIDTCCINKNNVDDQTELSFSIMSMFKWYKDAEACYAYLATVFKTHKEVQLDQDAFLDVASHPQQPIARGKPWKPPPVEWFQLGWTLQGLLAPHRMHFFNAQWTMIGSRSDLGTHIERAADILPEHLYDYKGASLTAKLSWLPGARPVARRTGCTPIRAL